MICQRENGGVCDCGDPEAWVQDFVCDSAIEDESYKNFKGRDIPPEFQVSFLQTIGIILDYIIDVMSQSDYQFKPPWHALTNPEEDTAQCTLDPMKYGYPPGEDAFSHDIPSEKYSLIAYNDQIRHFRDAVQRVHLASRKVPEFANMVAEKIQSHGRATVIRSRDYKLLLERQKILSATGLASCIRNARDEFREDMCDEIILWIASLTGREMFKSNITFKNLFCVAFGRKWEKGLKTAYMVNTVQNEEDYQCGRLDEFFNIPKVSTSDSNQDSLWYVKPSLWDVNPELCQRCFYNQSLDEYTLNSIRGSRFQYLVFLDVRFWKSIRTVIHDFFSTSLITNLEYKTIFACQYADIYPAIADMFLTIDGEPELNIMCTLSTQLFTCPSNSTALIHRGDVTRIFATIFNFLRDGQIRDTNRNVSEEEENNIMILSLKNRRWGQIFFDIGYILNRGKDKELISTPSIMPMACHILSLFQGKPILRREKENHVEYENTDYTAFFHAILVIYQFAEYICQCVTNLEAENRHLITVQGISCVASHLMKLETLPTNEAGSGINEVDYGPISNASIVNGERPVSFLHPLHSFLSWLIEYSRFSTIIDLKNTILDAIFTVSSQTDTPLQLIDVFKYPVRTCVLCSQVKSGYWVRNGFSVRSQFQLFKNTNLREQGYIRNLFLIQVYAACGEPDEIMESFLEFWLFKDGWIEGDLGCPVYEKSILPYMIEECLNFFIHILTEDVFLRGLSTEETTFLKIKNEIIHNLWFGPLSYTRLCGQIPEHIYSDKRFDSILDELAIFKKPKSSKESGTYILKEQYIMEIDPYYYNYSINKKDEAVKAMKEKIHKATKAKLHDITINPSLRNREELGIYKYLGNFSTSRIFMEFLIKTLNFICTEGNKILEGLLETALYLIHVCAMEQNIDLSKYTSFYDSFRTESTIFGTSLANQLHELLKDDAYKNYHATIRAIFKALCANHSSVKKQLSSVIPAFDARIIDHTMEDATCESETEKRKRVAKERQAKLMAKFKKQQSLFSKVHEMCFDCSDTEIDGAGDDEEGWAFPDPHCILCQDTAEDAGPFGIITYISKASEFRKVPFDDKYWFLKAFSDSSNLNASSFNTDDETKTARWKAYMKSVSESNIMGPGFSDQKLVTSNLVSLTCGHGMHFNCYMQFLSSNRAKLNQITRNKPEIIEHREFLCPLCKALNNMFIPILWKSNNRSLSEFVSPTCTASDNNSKNPFALILADIKNEEWFRKFCRSTTADNEKFSILTNFAKAMIGTSSNVQGSESQKQFILLLSNMFLIVSGLTFPLTFKADCPDILVNSLKSTEISLRGSNLASSLVIYQVPNNALINLRALNEFRATSILMKTTKWINCPSRNQADAHIKILSNLISLSPEYINETILRCDFIEKLVQICPIPSMGLDFNTVLRTCFIGHVIQSIHILSTQLLTHDLYSNKDYDFFDIPYSHATPATFAALAKKAFVQMKPKLQSFDALNNPEVGHVLYTMLLKSVTPFLRQAALYAYVCCSNVESTGVDENESHESEADALCSFLKIPNLSETLDRMVGDMRDQNPGWESANFGDFVKFSRRPINLPFEETIKWHMDYPGVIKLIDLPDRLDDFFTYYYYLDKYQNPHLSIENPAVCLFCSEVLDAQKASIGYTFGQCSTHFAKECANTVGIFLLPKERSMLLLHKNGGSFYDAPYLDQHGESPGDNKKTKPVYLLHEKYNDFIKHAWLQHNIPNLIVRKLDSVIDAGGWETL